MLPQPEALGEEEEVEHPALSGPREVDEGVELDLAARPGPTITVVLLTPGK